MLYQSAELLGHDATVGDSIYFDIRCMIFSIRSMECMAMHDILISYKKSMLVGENIHFSIRCME